VAELKKLLKSFLTLPQMVTIILSISKFNSKNMADKIQYSNKDITIT
jgi:hypothetical protein